MKRGSLMSIWEFLSYKNHRPFSWKSGRLMKLGALEDEAREAGLLTLKWLDSLMKLELEARSWQLD